MRLVPFDNIREGMIVGQNMYGLNGEILARQGNELKDNYIKRLSQYNIPYMYIIDKYSEDIEVQCTVSSSVKNEAVQNLKKLYNAILNERGTYHDLMQNCLESIDKIVDDIIAEKVNLYDIFDIKLLENYKYQHPIAVTIISVIIGKTLSLNALELYRLGVGAFFHDVGQMFVPKDVLNKKDSYTDSDFALMRKHPEDGYRFAKDKFYLPMKSYLAILQHHERFDGSGYPHKKEGQSISLYGRIVAIADVFDALSSEKTYRPALNPSKAFKTVIEDSGKAFDPDLIRIFAQKVSPYPVGYTLSLADDKIAIVVKNYEGKPFNPTVRVIKENNKLLDKPYTIDL